MKDTLKNTRNICNNAIKTIVFETMIEDDDNNFIGVKVTEEDGKVTDKLIDDIGLGNSVAQAMDVLCNRIFPIGAKFKVSIEVLDCPDTIDNMTNTESQEANLNKVHFIVDQVRYNTDDIPLVSRAETLARKLNYSKKDILYIDTTSSWDEIRQLKSGELNCLIIDEAQLFTPGQQDLLVDIIKELVRTKNIDVIITIDNGRIKENKNYIYNAFNT